jgi:hypothetical protein
MLQIMIFVKFIYLFSLLNNKLNNLEEIEVSRIPFHMQFSRKRLCYRIRNHKFLLNGILDNKPVFG